MKELEQEISTEQIFSDYQLMTEKCAELEQKKEQLNQLSDEWLELID